MIFFPFETAILICAIFELKVWNNKKVVLTVRSFAPSTDTDTCTSKITWCTAQPNWTDESWNIGHNVTIISCAIKFNFVMHTHAHTHAHARTHAHTRTHNAHTRAHTHTRTRTHTHAHAHTRARTHTHTHAHTRTHTRARTHTHIVLTFWFNILVYLMLIPPTPNTYLT